MGGCILPDIGSSDNHVQMGVGVNSTGVMTLGYVRQRIKHMIRRLNLVVGAGARMGSLRADIGLYLFGCMVVSLVAHALPVSTPGAFNLTLLDGVQATFARTFLGLPDSVPAYAALAELGLLSYHLRAAQSILLFYHRASNNPDDTLTSALMLWSRNSKGNTFDMLNKILDSMSVASTFKQFAALTYIEATVFIKDVVRSAQLARWERKAGGDATTASRAFRCKPKWGLERTLLFLPGDHVRLYLCIRNGAYKIPSASDGFSCNKCAESQAATLDHYAWACTSQTENRTQLIATMGNFSIHGQSHLTQATPAQALEFLLGKGGQYMPDTQWELTQNLCVSFIVRTCNDIALKPTKHRVARR